MRRKPVSRDEVRFNGRTITTAPADVVGPFSWRNPTEIFEPLWEPLVDALGTPMPPRFELVEGEPCRQCGRKFWRNYRSSGFYCSDRCAAIARRAKYAAAQGAARAAARRGRRCEGCGEPIEAARSTKRFCSTRCRVAAHRALAAQ
jgi:endogenous inhibitor of DNA gyrase (YacG/DUF329 family)